jgi:hypothetical protein
MELIGMSRTRFLAPTGALLILAAACAHHASEPQFRPDLSGKWSLNTTESTALTAPDSGREGRGRGVLGGRGGFGGVGGRGGFGGRGGRGGTPGGMGGGRSDAGEMREVIQSLRRGDSYLELTETDSTVAIGYSDSTTMRLRVDGEKRKVTWRGIPEVETRARWHDGTLEVDHKFEGGLSVKELYTRAPGSERLIVATTVKGGIMGERTGKRVYDRAAADK